MHQCMPWVSCWARYACISRLAQVRNHTPNGVPSGMITLLIVLLGNAFGLHHRGPAKFCWDDVFKPNAKVFHLHTPKAGVFTLSTYWRLPKDIPTSFGAERDAYSTKSFFFQSVPCQTLYTTTCVKGSMQPSWEARGETALQVAGCSVVEDLSHFIGRKQIYSKETCFSQSLDAWICMTQHITTPSYHGGVRVDLKNTAFAN